MNEKNHCEEEMKVNHNNLSVNRQTFYPSLTLWLLINTKTSQNVWDKKMKSV